MCIARFVKNMGNEYGVKTYFLLRALCSRICVWVCECVRVYLCNIVCQWLFNSLHFFFSLDACYFGAQTNKMMIRKGQRKTINEKFFLSRKYTICDQFSRHTKFMSNIALSYSKFQERTFLLFEHQN